MLGIIFILIIATLLMGAWIALLCKAETGDWEQALQARIFDTRSGAGRLEKSRREALKKIYSSNEFIQNAIMLITERITRRKLKRVNSELQSLMSGAHNSSDALIIPGYVLQKKLEVIGKSAFHKSILTKCTELYGKKNAEQKAGCLLAKILSYPVIGAAVTLMLGAAVYAAGITAAGLGIMVIGNALVLVLAYGMYDELNEAVKKRRIAIGKQFPGAISKLALLVTSGMIMDRAWKETAFSQETELYIEMQKTSEELDNLVSPEAAYGDFINRCNIKETAKLASAIMQNRTKGNAEIGRLFKDMAHEVWQERRHKAKRDAEKANSKLMIPTMLLFMAILVMLMVPIAMNFSGL